MSKAVNPLLPLGIGVGVGILSLYAVIELFPLIALGGAGYLVIKGLNINSKSKEETSTCSTGHQKK
jgi:hypothetical protein